ncbi:MAG: spermidine/putrescine import ATP-binding protein PotA [marine bacterium B5-7]|nr:MAG: spermidine/putrescine import ATP-binding protein PotA [marine bacterium B5-7]
MVEALIEIQGVSKSFKDQEVLHNIHLTVQRGEFLTLLGPSGCGKTTLLRLISGFEQADIGTITINHRNVTGLSANQRHVNTVFQSYALFPHMSVFDNVAFGLRCKHLPAEQIQHRVTRALARVKLQGFEHRKPHQLSGGQQQRVAIARAAVNEPLVLLLDEPLSSLDYALRKKMQMELKELQRDLGITFVFVTHDQEEALSMSDRIAVMHDGAIQQIGSPREVYEEPFNLKVGKFIGTANLFDTTILKAEEKLLTVTIEGIPLVFENRRQFKTGQAVKTLVRPEDLKVWDRTEVTDTSRMFPGIVEEVIYKGSTVDLVVRLHSNQKRLYATEFFDEDDENLDYHLGEQVWVEWYAGWEVILPDED